MRLGCLHALSDPCALILYAIKIMSLKVIIDRVGAPSALARSRQTPTSAFAATQKRHVVIRMVGWMGVRLYLMMTVVLDILRSPNRVHQDVSGLHVIWM